MKRSYTNRTLKLLWGKAGNLCAYPNCNNRLIINGNIDEVEGHICHIISEKGFRADSNYPKEKLNEYENLVLMCRLHHGRIDPLKSENCKKYPAKLIRSWKSKHEEHISKITNEGKPWKLNIGIIYYLNYPRLSMMAAMRGYDDTFFPKITTDNFIQSLSKMAAIINEFRNKLPSLFIKAIPLAALANLKDGDIGKIVSFSERLHSKNCPTIEEVKANKVKLSGNLATDPHLHFKLNNYKAYMTIDPRWITTSTSFTDLRRRGGPGLYNGIAVIKEINEEKKTIYLSPLVFGGPIAIMDALQDEEIPF